MTRQSPDALFWMAALNNSCLCLYFRWKRNIPVWSNIKSCQLCILNTHAVSHTGAQSFFFVPQRSPVQLSTYYSSAGQACEDNFKSPGSTWMMMPCHNKISTCLNNLIIAIILLSTLFFSQRYQLRLFFYWLSLLEGDLSQCVCAAPWCCIHTLSWLIQVDLPL